MTEPGAPRPPQGTLQNTVPLRGQKPVEAPPSKKRSADGDPAAPAVYVVDDDASMRRSLARFLRLEGRPVRAFETAEAFLAEYGKLTQGCLVVDIQLPGMSGLDLLERLAKLHCPWPIIAMSGSHEEKLEVDALRLGARTFLRKPFEPRVLADAIALALA